MTVVAYLVCAIVWGTTWFAIRQSIGEAGFPTLVSAALRFTIAAGILAAIAVVGWARPGPRGRRTLAWLAFAGVLNGAGYALTYTAEESVSGGLAAVIFGTFPLTTALIATLTRTERVRRNQIVGALVALAGIAVIFSDRLTVSIDQALGIAMMVGAVAFAGGYAVVLKREAADVNPLAATLVFLATTAVMLWMLSPALGPVEVPWPPPTRATIALLYLAIFGSVIAFASYLFLLKRMSLMGTTTLVFIQPVIAVIVDAFFEKEVRPSLVTYLGMAVVLAGVFFGLALQRNETTVQKSDTNDA